MRQDEILKLFDEYVERCDAREAAGRVDLHSVTADDLSDTYMPGLTEQPNQDTSYEFLIRWIIRYSISVAFKNDVVAAREWLTSQQLGRGNRIPAEVMRSKEGAIDVFHQLSAMHSSSPVDR